MHVVVYTKDNCGYCTKAKELLKSKNIDFYEMKIGDEGDISRSDFINLFPNVKSVPHILIENKSIGGYKELSEYF